MKNFYYKVGGEGVVVDEYENIRIQDAIERGGGLVFLREGSLAINTKFISFKEETSKLTDEQEKLKNRMLRLEGEKYKPPTEEQKTKVYKMVEEWKKKHLSMGERAEEEETKTAEELREERREELRQEMRERLK